MIPSPRTRPYKIVGLRPRTFLAALILLLNLLPAVNAIAAPMPVKPSVPPMTLSQVVDSLVARNVERAKDLESYQGRRTYTVAYRGFPGDLLATMVVDMNYDAPDTKEFTVVSQSGSKLLVDQVLKRLVKTETDAQQQKTRDAVNLNQQNYNFSNLEYQPAADGCSYVVSVEPKHRTKYLYRGKIWINDQDFAVCRIQAEPAQNPSFWIKSTAIAETYKKVGEFWLPAANTSVSKIRIGGSATLTIQYQDYKLPPPSNVIAHAALFSPSAR